MNQSSKREQQPKKLKKKHLVILGACIAVIVVALVYTLIRIKQKEEASDAATQEQFAGSTQISEQLQLECQKSAEKINDMRDETEMAAEFMKNAQNCREVYFYIEEGSFRPEGMYPDLVTDIANRLAKKNKEKAIELLKFAAGLGSWEYYMGPITCSSKSVIEAHIEALSNKEEKVCLNENDYKEKLLADFKNKSLTNLAKSLKHESIVSIGTIEAGLGCPEKMSNVIKFIQNATAGNLTIETEEDKSENKVVSFIFKTQDEDKLILEFVSDQSCLQLRNVLVPSIND